MIDNNDENLTLLDSLHHKNFIFKDFISESTYILEKNNKPDLRIHIRRCKEDELTAILALQRKVYDSIQAKETFVLSTEEELAESLTIDVCIGVYHNGELIAFTLMVANPYSSRNLGLYLQYSQEECMKCVTYDTTFVHPDFNGYGLQRLCVRLKDAVAVSLGAEEVLATVSPDNKISLNNLQAYGFTIIDQKKMYGNFDRYIMRKSLLSTSDD